MDLENGEMTPLIILGIIWLVTAGSLLALVVLARRRRPRRRKAGLKPLHLLKLFPPSLPEWLIRGLPSLPFDVSNDPSKDYVRDLDKKLQEQRRGR